MKLDEPYSLLCLDRKGDLNEIDGTWHLPRFVYCTQKCFIMNTR
jgi:hypothetical protein